MISVKVPTVKVDQSNRLDTGNITDEVYTKDLFTLEESPRLGCGVMVMKETTFDWTLNYDEIEKYMNFGGIRMERDVLIQEDGTSRILGDKFPRTADEIEEYMKVCGK